MHFSKGNRAPICQSSPPLAAVMQAIIGEGGKLVRIQCLWGTRWHHCSSCDILLFVLQDGARGEEGSHMVGIYQPMAARVIECELKVKLQTAERESRAWGLGSGTRLFIISLKGRSTVQWITLTTKLTACSLSALLHFAAVLSVQLEPNPLPVSLHEILRRDGKIPNSFKSNDPIFLDIKWLLTPIKHKQPHNIWWICGMTGTWWKGQ